MPHIEKLKKLLAVLDPSLPKEEVVKALEGALFLNIKILEEAQESIELIGQKVDEVKKLKGDKGKEGEQGEHGERGEKGVTGLRGETGKDGKRGLGGRNGERGNDGKVGERGKSGSPDSPTEVRDKLESLTGKERLDVDSISGLKKIIKEIPERPVKTFMTVGGGGRNSVQFTDLSSKLDGSTKTFYVPKRRYIALFGTQFPILFRPIIDYTGDGTGVLTLTSEVSAPESGQTLILLHSRV